jgi:hypothetical protein
MKGTISTFKVPIASTDFGIAQSIFRQHLSIDRGISRSRPTVKGFVPDFQESRLPIRSFVLQRL